MEFNQDIADKLKFIGHILFTIFEIYAVFNILLLSFNLIFYFGFITTICITCGILSIITMKDNITEKISNNNFGKILLMGADIVFDICNNILLPYIKNPLSNLLTYLVDNLLKFNNYLSHNTNSQYLQQRITAEITKKAIPLVMGYGMKQMFKPSGTNGNPVNPLEALLSQFKSMPQQRSQSGLNFGTANFMPPTNFTSPTENEKEIEAESQMGSNIYKNITINNNSSNMSFLNTAIVEDDLIDDDLDNLDDELEDCLNDCLEELEQKTNAVPNKPVVYRKRPPTKNKKKNKNNKNKQMAKPEIEPHVLAENVRTQEENRLLCKKKLAEKRSARLGHQTNSLSQSNTRNMSQSQIKEIIMQKDNLDLIMKEFPLDANGKPEITQEKIKRIAHTLINK